MKRHAIFVTAALIAVIVGSTFWDAGKKTSGFALLALIWLGQNIEPIAREIVPPFNGFDAFVLVAALFVAAGVATVTGE